MIFLFNEEFHERLSILNRVFLVIAIVVLPQFAGILSLVWGMGACMVVAGLLNVYMINKHLKIKIDVLKPTIKFLGISLPCAILGKNIYGILISIFPSFISLAISGIVIVVSFFVLCLLFNLIKIDAIFQK